MVTLDKITLSVPCYCITEWRHTSTVYNSEYTDLPYHLYIGYNERYGSYKVEFSAKILGDRYPDLINENNFMDCLGTINNLGICTLDIERVICSSSVIGADFTKDILLSEIPCASGMNDIKSILRLSIRNYNRWNCANYQGGGMVITNAVNDKRRQKRLTVYDKWDELRMAHNRPFMQSLNDREYIEEYFRGRVRFELRATTPSQICTWLGLGRGYNTIANVLNSTTNPLRMVMNEMFKPIFAVDESEIKPTLTNLDKLCTLKTLEWDLAMVEAHVRASTTRSVKAGMRAYERLYSAHRLSQTVNVVDIVRD